MEYSAILDSVRIDMGSNYEDLLSHKQFQPTKYILILLLHVYDNNSTNGLVQAFFIVAIFDD